MAILFKNHGLVLQNIWNYSIDDNNRFIYRYFVLVNIVVKTKVVFNEFNKEIAKNEQPGQFIAGAQQIGKGEDSWHVSVWPINVY